VRRTLLAIYPEAQDFVDVGSGTGAYAAELVRAGRRTIALEHSSYGRALAQRQGVECRHLDLTRTPPTENLGRFDVAYCFEVAEHLSPPLGDILVEFIATLAPHVVFTAAAPGQLGIGHVNCQPQSYWIERFTAVGFLFNERRTRFAAECFRQEDVIYFLTNNVMIFEKTR
jgi:SAM-dependent methyltransferase